MERGHILYICFLAALNYQELTMLTAFQNHKNVKYFSLAMEMNIASLLKSERTGHANYSILTHPALRKLWL